MMPFTFLICSERSGSNFIAKIMDAHAEVCGPSPTHITRIFAENLLNYGDLSLDDNWRTLLADVASVIANALAQWRREWTADALVEAVEERTLAGVLRCVFEAEARAHDKSRLFIKENHTYRFLPFLVTAFPEARFVYLVRDPRDMALSMKSARSVPGGVIRAAGIWHQDQSSGLRAYGGMRQSGRILLLRYEDLVADAERQVARVCDFLGIGYRPEMLEFYKNETTRLNAERLEAWSNLARPILRDNFNKYRGRLSELEIRYVEAVNHRQMETLGYPRDFDPVADPDKLRPELAADEAAAGLDEVEYSAREQEIREARLGVLQRILGRRLPFADSTHPF